MPCMPRQQKVLLLVGPRLTRPYAFGWATLTAEAALARNAHNAICNADVMQHNGQVRHGPTIYNIYIYIYIYYIYYIYIYIYHIYIYIYIYIYII